MVFDAQKDKCVSYKDLAMTGCNTYKSTFALHPQGLSAEYSSMPIPFMVFFHTCL